MARMRCQIITRGASQLPKDHVVNTVHFSRAGLWDAVWSGPDAEDTANDVRDMFAATRQYIPPDYGVQVKVYDLDEPEPRFPKFTTSWVPYAQAGGVHAPREVALCLSFRGELNVPRQRGRIFLGPYIVSSMAIRPEAGIRTNALALATGLANIGGPDIDWCVFSKYPLAAGTDGGTMHSIQHAWVDDEWDTVRSRGFLASTRSTLALSE